MSGLDHTSKRGGLFLVVLGAIAGVVVGAVSAGVILLLVLRPPGGLHETEREAASPTPVEFHPRLPTKEVLEYFEGKPLRLPDGPGGGEKTGKDPVIQRHGVKQLTWESSMSAGGSKVHTHHYALLYDAGDTHYFADVHIDVRQVGEKRAYLGFQTSNVRKADMIVDATPK